MTQDHNIATHTQGPWLIGEEQCVDECWSIVTTSGGAIVANVNDNAKRRANARLISAAPDMLEALRYADAEFERLGLPEDCSPRIGVRAAIAKAEGRK